MKTKAVVLRDLAVGPQIEVVELRSPRAGEALVRMVASGICGSDLHAVHGNSTAAVLPTILGHEGSGVIQALGDDASRFAVGDRVVLSAGPAVPAILKSGEVLNLYAGQGTMAEHCLVTVDQLVAVPDDVPLDVMALTGCGVLTGIGTVLNANRPSPGESALVIGCGGVGLNVMQACDLVGAHPIIAVDTNPARLALASQFGASHTVLAGVGVDLHAAVRELAPWGVDWAYEVVGRSELIRTAWDLIRSGGTCVVVGAAPPGDTIQLDARDLMISQKHLVGALMGGRTAAEDLPRIFDLYRRGRIKLDELVGARIPFDEARRAIEETDAGLFARCLLTFEAS